LSNLVGTNAVRRLIGAGDLLDGKTVSSVVIRGSQSLSSRIVGFAVTFADRSSAVYLATFADLPSGPSFVRDTIRYSASTGFRASFEGEVGTCYRIQYATNLPPTVWFNLTNFAYSSPVTITDPGAVSSRIRFYRAVPCTP
jgi:hypothetical protein